jgi:23S rRNA G2069 N7-methylase RlmK/C1962 C5-methylase RlmI
MSALSDTQCASERERMLINRVKKNARHRRKWARREGITCLRLYDQDIPELPLVIDNYEGRLHASVFMREGDELVESERLCLQWLKAVATALQLNPDHVYLKIRARQRGSDQYRKRSAQGERVKVGESGLSFWVNFQDYLDTGLFLDHRR